MTEGRTLGPVESLGYLFILVPFTWAGEMSSISSYSAATMSVGYRSPLEA